ncbi:hypothetical protein BaRGS_00023383 [Batillaria attramentaria]|uniref:PiggyBac transposable element-derived protein domain-containing protein n=1 Tax=Batillaria attramentaria TaxID=370345 RepID=A0ABD0KEQ1_9CAEN
MLHEDWRLQTLLPATQDTGEAIQWLATRGLLKNTQLCHVCSNVTVGTFNGHIDGGGVRGRATDGSWFEKSKISLQNSSILLYFWSADYPQGQIYLCCESDGEKKGSGGGYCYRFKVYTGKDDPVNEVRPILEATNAMNPSLSASENMVLFLVAPLLGKGYHVYRDNWYLSLKLFMFLLEKQTLACGTVRENRGIPEVLAHCFMYSYFSCCLT